MIPRYVNHNKVSMQQSARFFSNDWTNEVKLISVTLPMLKSYESRGLLFFSHCLFYKRLQMNNWNSTEMRFTYITCTKDRSPGEWRTFHLTSSSESVMHKPIECKMRMQRDTSKKNGSHIHKFPGVIPEINYFSLCSSYIINLIRL